MRRDTNQAAVAGNLWGIHSIAAAAGNRTRVIRRHRASFGEQFRSFRTEMSELRTAWSGKHQKEKCEPEMEHTLMVCAEDRPMPVLYQNSSFNPN